MAGDWVSEPQLVAADYHGITCWDYEKVRRTEVTHLATLCASFWYL
jgi:hypothetical protein